MVIKRGVRSQKTRRSVAYQKNKTELIQHPLTPFCRWQSGDDLRAIRGQSRGQSGGWGSVFETIVASNVNYRRLGLIFMLRLCFHINFLAIEMPSGSKNGHFVWEVLQKFVFHFNGRYILKGIKFEAKINTSIEQKWLSTGGVKVPKDQKTYGMTKKQNWIASGPTAGDNPGPIRRTIRGQSSGQSGG